MSGENKQLLPGATLRAKLEEYESVQKLPRHLRRKIMAQSRKDNKDILSIADNVILSLKAVIKDNSVLEEHRAKFTQYLSLIEEARKEQNVAALYTLYKGIESQFKVADTASSSAPHA